MLARLKWLSKGLVSQYTLDHFHSLSFGTLAHIAEVECERTNGGPTGSG